MCLKVLRREMNVFLEQLIMECAPYIQRGAVANYIPELSKVNADALGAYIVSCDGKHYFAGDYSHKFTIQSIVKPILLLQALLDNGIFQACSISVTCKDLANIGFVLANHGCLLGTNKHIVPANYAQYVNAILMTCGMYDGSGEFAVRVGLPAKSGVGGGIMAVVPTRMGIGIYSPTLDSKGNSVAGIQMLERLSHQLYLSIF